ncbi:MAG: HAMP domain-containing histidine kinase [Eubacterium sp.]|nr:HAMP domain-containing histidine kinase [Eubacterium sp.]
MDMYMSMSAFIFILIIIILFLLIKIFLMKKEMRRITSEMKDNTDNNQVSVDFVDGDLQKLIVQINNLYESVMKIKVEGKEDEKKIRESISMIAHDMRTPLTSIIGYLQVAERLDDAGEKNENIEIALERARYLNKLVNDFFELSLIESGQVNVQMEKVNLSEIICEEILSESPEIDRKGIEPVFEQAEENIYVYADKKKLERVIQNLISNAVKYSVKKLEFVIGIEEAPVITLRIITDATESINTDKIFDRFYQQDSSRTKGGAGLGLYICKSFVEMMYGSISAKQEGDLFEIDLKLAKNESM